MRFPVFAVGHKPTSRHFDAARVDQVLDVTQTDAEQTARALAREEEFALASALAEPCLPLCRLPSKIRDP